MSGKKSTFKEHIRKNDLKRRHKISADLRKRVGAGRRTRNRFDYIDAGQRTMDEIVHDIAQGAAVPSQEFNVDPRGLTDMLLRSATAMPVIHEANTAHNGIQAGKKTATEGAPSCAMPPPRAMLPTAPLPKGDPSALPDLETTLAEVERQKERTATMAKVKRNHYRHHGQPFLFWEHVGLHPLLLQALRAMKFTHPTPVQEEVLPQVFLASSLDNQQPLPVCVEGGGQGAPPAKRSRKRDRNAARAGCQDIVVSAETGSGKTLVFALPILNDILRRMDAESNLSTTRPSEGAGGTQGDNIFGLNRAGVKRAFTPSRGAAPGVSSSTQPALKKRATAAATVTSSGEREGVPAVTSSGGDARSRLMHSLIVSPTRELALQINDAFKQFTQFAPHVTVGCVVGGMAAEKQQRVLNRHPHILICTPGRLWDLVQRNEGCYLGHSVSRRLHFVVLDEADKLLQSGRFEQLKSMLERIHSEVLPAGFLQNREEGAEAGELNLSAGRWDPVTQTFIPFSEAEAQERACTKRCHKKDDEGPVDADDAAAQGGRLHRKDQPRTIPMPHAPPEGHRVATFVTSATLSLQCNYERKDLKANKKVIRTSNADVMGKIMQELGIKQSQARVFSLSEHADVASKINEAYLRCPDNSKDLYLYYFLKMFTDERTVVFVNAISMLRRLVKIMEVLGIPVVGLHASMQQRQRLKFIDKFRRGETRVLVATDIASRGLDIEGLKYVVHYQVPRSTDAYIHRCGRTARCGGTGLSVLLVSAAEHMSFRKLMESLGRKESDMEIFAVQPSVVHQLHPHLRMAWQIDKLQKEIAKSRDRNQWVQRMNKEADLEVDDMYDHEAEAENREKQKAIRILKKDLERMGKKFTGSYGGKGAFRTGAHALGAKMAEEKLRVRAERQALKKL